MTVHSLSVNIYLDAGPSRTWGRLCGASCGTIPYQDTSQRDDFSDDTSFGPIGSRGPLSGLGDWSSKHVVSIWKIVFRSSVVGPGCCQMDSDTRESRAICRTVPVPTADHLRNGPADVARSRVTATVTAKSLVFMVCLGRPPRRVMARRRRHNR